MSKPQSSKLNPISSWFNSSFAYIGQNFSMLFKAWIYGMLLYFGISLLVSLGLGALVAGAVALNMGWNVVTIPLAIVGGIAFFITLLAVAGKMILLQIKAVQTPLKSVRETWRELRWQDGLSIYWLLFVVMLAIYTSLIALIIPAIIVGTWLIFSFFTWQSGQSSVKTMIKSRDYVRGFFWPIFGRMFLAGLGFFLVIILTLFIYIKMLEVNMILGIVGYIIYMLAVGLGGMALMRLNFELYQNIVEIKGELKNEISTGRNVRWHLLAYGPIFLGLIATLILLGLNPEAQIKKAQDQLLESQKESLEDKLKIQELQNEQNLEFKLDSEE